MPDLGPILELLGRLFPFDGMDARFMQRALLALALLGPAAGTLGVHVINLRMAFFSDAISHSAFAGVAIGLLASMNPRWTMPAFGALVAVGIVALQLRSRLSSDAAIGVTFSAVVAFGLAVISRQEGLARDVQTFVFGDILTIGEADIGILAALVAAIAVYQAIAYNRLTLMALSPTVAKVRGARVDLLQYLFAVLTALVVTYSVLAVGVFLVTALLIVPAAAARNLARTAGGMIWYAAAIGLASSVGGLILSAQPWAGTATGASVVLVGTACFVLSLGWASVRARSGR